jgi:hypothetical protein
MEPRGGQKAADAASTSGRGDAHAQKTVKTVLVVSAAGAEAERHGVPGCTALLATSFCAPPGRKRRWDRGAGYPSAPWVSAAKNPLGRSPIG